MDEITARCTTAPAPDAVADSYARDPRVDTYPDGGGYRVLANNGEVYEVMWAGLFGWSLCQGPNRDFVQLPAGGVTDAHFAIGAPSAGELIRALVLGPPRR